MNEQERLLQQFIDQDLSPAERLQFLESLDRDPALRRRLIRMERLLVEAAALPRLAPPSGFAARVLACLDDPQPGWWARMRGWLVSPHVLQWNPAGALAAACIALLLVTWASNIISRPVTEPALQMAAPDQTVFVRVALLRPEAQSVAIVGDFNGWDPQGLPLRHAGNGLWTLTIPLKPGRYQYMYRVDGRWVTDPLASEFSPDGFGDENAVLDIRDLSRQEAKIL